MSRLRPWRRPRALADLAVRGAVRPVVQRGYALADAAEALREIGGGHVRGKLVVTVP